MKKTNELLIQRSLKTIERLNNLGDEGIPDFNWNLIEESDNFKSRTTRYKELSIVEAFEKEYDFKTTESNMYSDYREIKIGDVIPLKILDVTRRYTIFEQPNIKENIVSTINLFKYPNFRDHYIGKTVDFKVASIDKDTIRVDPISGLFDTWISNLTSDLKNQYSISEDRSILVEDLSLIRGGFIGRVRVDSISDVCGTDMWFPVFIPGSQIVLNIEYDFSKWVGQSTRAFINSYSIQPNRQNTLICSSKAYLQHQGNLQLIEWYNLWCLQNEEWDELRNKVFSGKITGVCHTSRKCGVFIELPQNITAMLPRNPGDLSRYHRGDYINVSIDSFDELLRWNGFQKVHMNPYVIDGDILKECNLKLNLKEV